MPHQPRLIAETPGPYDARRQAEREKYLERLRQYLQDPDFRTIEGFPLGDDEAILALSDPPYYTACPNPFLPEIIERWQQEREEMQSADGSPSPAGRERATEGRGGEGGEPYHREPFAADVSEGKNDPIYNAHSYHTKVPHKAIMRYILHYTRPGDIVFDGFCGTGMTGVAAQLCGDRKVVESLGYRVQEDGLILDEKGQPVSALGSRKAVLCDLSPAATFIAYNYNTPVDVKAFEQEARRILREVEEECGWMYETLHTDGKTKGRINYTVWSDVFRCPECGEEMIFWDVAVDKESGRVLDEFSCPECSVVLKKRILDRALEAVWNDRLGKTVSRSKQVPVLINYTVSHNRYEKRPTEKDIAHIRRIEDSSLYDWFPTTRIDRDIDLWYERDYRSLGIYSVTDFFYKRTLTVLARFKQLVMQIQDPNLRLRLLWVLTAVIEGSSKLNRERPGRLPSKLSGTLYVGATIREIDTIAFMTRKIKRFKNLLQLQDRENLAIVTQSTTRLLYFSDRSVDYIFTDPPFGSNIIYSDLNILWEAWLKVFTSTETEAVVHRRKKQNPMTLSNYLGLMIACFEEYYRVLKSGRWMTVEFHNTQNAVWNAIQEAISRAGFIIADVRTLDKGGSSFKQVTAAGAVKQDLIISAYKPTTDFEQQFLAEGGREKGAWDFIRQHLEQLPVVVEKEGVLEVVAERQAYLLYDRMVAFHVQRGFSVPLSAPEFYAGLKQKFPERDGMYFLPPQAAEYDRQRLKASRVEQLALFVSDEKSARQWLMRELDPDTGSGPLTYQELQPRFLRELHQARHEKLPELRDMLEEGFIQDELGRWMVPNPERQEHLEQLRERGLLREFQEYAGAGKGRLKLFRTEAVRAGFKRAWADKNYRLIVQVAQRLPDSVLQEDPGLLMYYDNALMRADKEPRQLGF